MSDWVSIAPAQFSGSTPPPLDESVNGIDMRVAFSPYDLPVAVKGAWSHEREKFCITFKYLSDEPKISVVLNDLVTGDVGKHTGRIYELHVDVKKAGVDAVRLNCTKALEGYRQGKIGNFAARVDLAEKAIQVSEDRLFQEA